MVHQLEVPLADAGLQIDGDEALREDVVAGTVADVFVDRRRLDWQIHEACLRIDADLGPDTSVPRPFPRPVFPGVVAELTRHRNGIESPDLFAGADVERPNETFGIGAVQIAEALEHGRADDDDVADDGRRRVQANFTALQIDLLVATDDDALLQVEDAVLSE